MQAGVRPSVDAARPIRLWISVSLILVVVGLVYGRSLSHPFVWTDHAEIGQGALVPKTGQELWRTLTMAKGSAKTTARSEYEHDKKSKARWAYWRPVKALSYGLDHQIGEGSAWAYHLSNLLLHAAACLALLLFVRRATHDRLPGLAESVALLQAVAPLHIEAVAWVSARSDVLVAGFSLLAAWALLRARVANSTARVAGYRLLSGLMIVMAIGSKETGLMAAAFLGLVSLLLPDPNRPGRLGRLLAECWLPGLLSAGLVGWRLLVVADIHLGSLGSRSGLGVWTWLDLFGRNLWLSFVPLWSSVADTVQVRDGPSLAAVAGPLAYLLWLGLGIRTARRSPLVLLSALGWLLSILPVSQLLPLLHPRGDRYLYLPAAFAALALGLAAHRLVVASLSRWPGRTWPRWTAAGLVALALLGMGLRSNRLLRAWSDERSLFEEAVAAQPNCVECWNNLAYAAAIAGDIPRAVAACRAGLAVDRDRHLGAKDSFSLHWILARALLELGRGAEAAAELELILVKAGPSRATLTMLAQAYLEAGRPAHALAAAEWALDQEPRDRALQHLVIWCARSELEAGFPWLFDFPSGCLANP